MVDFLLKQWLSSILAFDIEHIFVGLNNNILLPKTEPFIVIQFITSESLQKAFYSATTPNINGLVASSYQIDFYRATNLATQLYLYISSYIYPDWGNFIDYSPPKNLTNTDSTDRYLQRYSLDVTISHEIQTAVSHETFTDVTWQLQLIQ